LGRLTQFLSVPSLELVGNDEQYAATFALMVNELGMPARVVVGAIPGQDGAVTGNDVHAWVEVRIANGGWVTVPQTMFMPDPTHTPRPHQPPSGRDAHAAVVPPPVAAALPSQLFNTNNARSTSRRSQQQQHKGLHLVHVPGYIGAILKYAGIPVLAIFAICGAIVGAKAQRRRVRRSRGPAHGKFAKGWREVVDRARDVGVVVPASGTRREQAVLLSHLGVAHLAHQADAGVFGPGMPSEAAVATFWKSVDAACRAMRKSLSFTARIRAAVSLRSFLVPRAMPTAASEGPQ
jgi:hypothetical protein